MHSDCVSCPANGTCAKGILECEPGYIRVGSKCAEDQESAIYAEELAQEAYVLLQHHAGRAECGQATTRYITAQEIQEALSLKHSSDGQSRGLLSWGSRPFDPTKFDHAFEKALKKLQSEEYVDVTISVLGQYVANTPILSLYCIGKQTLRQNWEYVTAALIVIVLFIYLRIKLLLKRREEARIEAAYTAACDIIRDRKRCYMKEEEEYAFISDVVLRQEVLGLPTRAKVMFWKKVDEVLQNDKRIVYCARKFVKGHPMNTYEWRGRISSGDILASGGSVYSYDSSFSDGLSVQNTPNRTTPSHGSRLESVRRWLFQQG